MVFRAFRCVFVMIRSPCPVLMLPKLHGRKQADVRFVCSHFDTFVVHVGIIVRVTLVSTDFDCTMSGEGRGGRRGGEGEGREEGRGKVLRLCGC